jgi:anti-sigma B factor antagonist
MAELGTVHSTSTNAGTLLTVQRRRRGPAVIVQLTGEVDMNSAHAMRQALTAALADATPPHPIVVNLTDVGFFSSSGLAELTVAHQRAADQRTPLRVVAANRTVLRPLEVAGMTALFAIHQDVGSALAAAAPAAAHGRPVQRGDSTG